MIKISEEEFRRIVAEAIDSLPAQIEHMNNVAIVVEELPTEDQLRKLHVYQGRMLFGLYEGIPLTRRSSGYNMVLPDKITIFQKPLEASAADMDDLRARVRHTVWHEIAHHYGLDHDRIRQLENKQ